MSNRKAAIPPRVEQLLHHLWQGQRDALPSEPVGLYLYGSLVWGDFDLDISDMDLTCVLEEDVDAETLKRLERMHTALAQEFPEWDDRIEVQYVAREALQHFREIRHSMANISPGEPLHIIEAGKEWLSNWYMARAYGSALQGPEPQAVFPDVALEEFLQAIREYAQEWQTHVVNTRDSRPYQSYGVLTMCRALYTLTHKQQVSKQKAAGWVQQTYPQFAPVIEDALQWRADARSPSDPAESYPRAKAAIHDLYELMPKG